MATSTTTTKLPAIVADKAPTWKAPDDVTTVRTLLTGKGAANLTTDDLLVIVNQLLDNQRKASANLSATVKLAVRDTVSRYEQVGAALALMFARTGRKGEPPAAGTRAGVADIKAMLDHLQVNPQLTWGMSDSTLQVCVDAFNGSASANYAAWSDLRASDDKATIAAREAAPSFYGNDAQHVIRWSLAKSKGNVDPHGEILVRGNRTKGQKAEDVPMVPASEVKADREEASKRALADAVKVLTTKRSNTLIGVGPDVTVATINAMSEDDLKRLTVFIAARREVIRATKPQHDAGKAAATARTGAKAKASAK